MHIIYNLNVNTCLTERGTGRAVQNNMLLKNSTACNNKTFNDVGVG